MEENLDATASIAIAVVGYNTTFNVDSGESSVWARMISTSMDVNVIVFDWTQLAFESYLCLALLVTPACAKYLADVVTALKGHHGIPHENITFCGYSLGAQLIGLASEQLPEKINKCLGTIQYSNRNFPIADNTDFFSNRCCWPNL